MSEHFTASTALDLEALCQRVELPVTATELIELAGAEGTERDAETFRRLPDQTWHRIEEAIAAAVSGWKNPGHTA